MAASLFRIEAVEFQRTRAWAGATTPPPIATWLLTIFFAASITGAILFLALGSYAAQGNRSGISDPGDRHRQGIALCSRRCRRIVRRGR